MSQTIIDFGDGHTGYWLGWRPDRNLNPHYDGIADVEKFGLAVQHKKPDGSDCEGFVTIEGEAQRKVHPDAAKWTLVQEDPITLTPSLHCNACGDHGFITNGKWVRA